ncbi:hypothetical protein Hanom_Chr10g00909231 [Helianthus anomalus]
MSFELHCFVTDRKVPARNRRYELCNGGFRFIPGAVRGITWPLSNAFAFEVVQNGILNFKVDEAPCCHVWAKNNIVTLMI